MSPFVRNAASAAAATASLLVLTAAPAGAQQVVRPPVAQYWMDVATHSMAGMPDMPEMPGMPSLPSFMGGGGAAGGAAGGNHYGNTRAMSPGRWLDLALYTRNKPSGSDAVHAIPPGLRMGASLPLVPVTAVPRGRGEDADRETPERPTGRVLVYWGCGEAVRAGQPRVIDLSGDPQAFGRAFAGRFAPDRGARVAPGFSLWPNDKSGVVVPRGASLVGEHTVSGEGVPAGLKFAIGPGQEFMPAIGLASSGALSDSVALQWPAVTGARAYYLHAMGTVGKDLVLWSSAETPDGGMGLFDYLSNATIERWIGEKVLLPASATRCAVPKGIFAGGDREGAMLRMVAYGGELNLAHPPRPADARTPWEPEWAVRVRVKATTMAMLGVDIDASASARAPVGSQQVPAQSAGQPAETTQPGPGAMPSIPGIPEAGRAIDAIRGIFGR